MEKLQKLKVLYEDGILTEDEYNRRKNDIIDSMLNSGNGNDAEQEEHQEQRQESPRHQANPTRGAAASPRTVESQSRATTTARVAAPPGGRVVVANAPPPSGSGRVVYVDTNAHGVMPAAAKPVLIDKDGRLMCFRCGEPITTKVFEWEHQACDGVCFRLVQVGVDDLKMPNTALAEPPPVRTYRNREGEAQLAVIAKKNAEFQKKHRKFENNTAAKLEKAKDDRRKKLEKEAAKK